MTHPSIILSFGLVDCSQYCRQHETCHARHCSAVQRVAVYY